MRTIIDSTWEADPNHRPMFYHLVDTIASLLDDQIEQLPAMRDIGSTVQKLMIKK